MVLLQNLILQLEVEKLKREEKKYRLLVLPNKSNLPTLH